MAFLDFLPSRRRIRHLESKVSLLQERQRLDRSRQSGVDISNGKYQREFNANLKPEARWATYDKMIADPHIKSGLDGKCWPLLTAQVDIVPASDERRDIEIANFVEANLLRRTNEDFGSEVWCQTSWQQRLFETLDMLQSGFSLFHKTYAIEGDKVFYERLTWLEPSTIDPHDGWRLDGSTGDLLAVRRKFSTPEGRFIHGSASEIPVEELSLFVWEMKGNRFDGRPMLRSLYGPWFRKDFMQRIGAIWVQKAGSPIPLIFYPPALQQDAGKFTELAKMMRGSAPDHAYHSSAKASDGTEPTVKYAGVETGEVDRVGSLVDRENAEIAAGADRSSRSLADPNRTTGSRAVGETLMAGEVFGLRFVAEWVSELMTHGAGNMPGQIEELVDRNYSGVTSYPRLTFSQIDPLENISRVGPLSIAVEKGLIPRHEMVQREVSAWFGLKLPDDAFDQQPAEEIPTDREPMPPDDGEDERDDEEMALATREEIRARLAPLLQPVMEGAPDGGGFRHMTKFEAEFVDLGAIDDRQRVGAEKVAAVLMRAHVAAIAELKGRVTRGKLIPRNIGSQRRSKFRQGPKFVRQLDPVLTDIGGDGALHAAEELARQERRDIEALALPGDVEIGGGGLIDKALRAFGNQVEVTAGLSVDGIWNRLLSEGIAEFERLTRQGFTGVELADRLEAFLSALSTAPVTDLGRQASSVAYNAGRDMTAQTAFDRDLVTHALRSEVLDLATCRRCLALDGKIVEIGSAEYQEFMPPAKCEGRDRCRGFYVLISRQLVEELPEAA